jgi:3-oxoadipate CoA-transferase, alpha subunit
VINKIADSLMHSVQDIHDGATVMIGGFGAAGMPNELVDALREQGAKNLTVISNNAGNGDAGLALLIRDKRVRKIICTFPRQADSHHFDAAFNRGEIELELIPQGNLSEQMRAAGVGVAGFYVRTGAGTLLAREKEIRRFNGVEHVFLEALHADFALIKAHAGDRWGNLIYRKAARNFGPIMAMAAAVTIASVNHIVELGSLDPESIVTPGIFVKRVVKI